MQTFRAPGGVRVGPYELVRPLGSGATSVVYEAVDPSGRRVALKLFHLVPDAERNHTARFLREAQAAQTVRHPNIVEIFDFGESDGAAFLV
ncbi:MAG TPA: protein kinase, partial [Polyangiaceae bacterium]|nr:protein kinase [Polyangiaceae bacterium]